MPNHKTLDLTFQSIEIGLWDHSGWKGPQSRLSYGYQHRLLRAESSFLSQDGDWATRSVRVTLPKA